jgi:hypothetical protein
MGHKVAGTTGLYLHVMRETFDKVEMILDQAVGDALRARFDVKQGLVEVPEDRAPAPTPPPRF